MTPESQEQQGLADDQQVRRMRALVAFLDKDDPIKAFEQLKDALDSDSRAATEP
jgi:hypothetical protein